MVLYYLIDKKNRNLITIAAIALAILLNGVFSYTNDHFGLPIFMDSIFTIMTAALFGFWPSFIVGILTNSFLEVINGLPGNYFPFTIVNLLSAIITSLFVNHKRFETATHAFWLIIILSLVNALTGTLIAIFFFGGYTQLSLDNMVKGIMITGRSIFTSAFSVRIVVNIVDKGIAVLPTFFLYKIIQAKSNVK